MTTASLVLAVLAILISTLSVLYTRRQALAATGVYEIERSRRLDERRPRFSGKVERHALTGKLVITLESDEALSSVELVIRPRQGVVFNRNI
jgi:hypothetical protein